MAPKITVHHGDCLQVLPTLDAESMHACVTLIGSTVITTGMACLAEGFDSVLIEQEAEHVADIRRRSAHVKGDDTPLFAVPE